MAEENNSQTNKSFSLDWLVGGVLTKLGDTFDRLTGRGWNPSSSLATSKLIEKLKFLLDSEVRDLGKEGKFVPHIIKLKIQWDKFSTEAEKELDKLRYELHAAAIDHINDRLYHTYAPLNIEIKTDYFTEGVRMLASFGKFSDKEDDEVAVNVTVPNLKTDGLLSNNKITVNLTEEQIIADSDDRFIARFYAKNKAFEKELNFSENKRISVGRSSTNELAIDDQSVSKIHAALVLNSEKQLMVADTGSTNGTFINAQRIAYGKAVAFEDDAKLKFGTVEVTFERLETYIEEEIIEEDSEVVVDHEIMPTQMAVNYKPNESNSELKATEIDINISENEIAELVSHLDSEADSIQPTQANVNVSEENNVSADNSENVKNAEDETPENFYETPENEKSKQINLDKTQDWEL